MWKAGPNPLLSPPLTFPEVNQVPIRCWVDSESFPVFWPEQDSNLRPSAPQPSALTTRPRHLTVVKPPCSNFRIKTANFRVSKFFRFLHKWAAAWQNQQNDLCAQRRLGSAWADAQSDQSSLCAQCLAKVPMLLHVDSEDWSDWADAQTDLSLRWAHRSFCWFCRAVAS